VFFPFAHDGSPFSAQMTFSYQVAHKGVITEKIQKVDSGSEALPE